MSGISEKQEAILREFQGIDDWQERYRRILSLGRELAPMDASVRTDANKVKGCQSQVWLHASLDGGRVVYAADSDAQLVRGLVALLVRVYSGHTPDEILGSSAKFIDELGLNEHLSQSRANGLSAMIRQIRYYALAFKALTDRAGSGA